MIKLEQINKYYYMGKSKLHVLKGINLHIKEGEFISIMGASGSGKTTLLNILGILDNYEEGSFYLDGQLIKNMNERDAAICRNHALGFVFQSFNLVSFKNALENVALPLYYQGVKRKKRNELAEKYLAQLGMAERTNHMPNELSGGQKQRVAIARALITDPKVILADEPTGALDSTTSLEVMQILTDINARGKTVIVVTHEHDIAAMTNKIIWLKDGVIDRIIEGEEIIKMREELNTK